VSNLYVLLYGLGFTPRERYVKAAATSIGMLLDREQAERSSPLGRALDLYCGRGVYAHALAKRGWQVVGIDNVPRALRTHSQDGSWSQSSPRRLQDWGGH
jgi:2-polyprenyl-3-methyl-5-hydroxy-6-metoxy-1,4-benzoquinol methylase